MSVKILKFSATWCGPCRVMAPAVKEAVSDFQEVELEEVDVDTDDNELSLTYGVRSVPTLIFLKDGKEIDRVVGMKTAEQLKNIINRTL